MARSSLSIILAAVTKMITIAVNPSMLFDIPSQSIPASIFIATAKIVTATAKPIMDNVRHALDKLLTILFNELLPEVFISFMRAIAPTNIPNSTPMAITAVPSLSESIVDITNSDPASIAIAEAILSSVPAFNCS